MRRLLVAAVLAGGLLVTGCGLPYPPDALPLPGREGTGGDAIRISVEMPDVVNVTPNQEVRVNDVEVGHVESIAFDNWHARVVVGLDPGTRLPKDTSARIAQKSLLGAEYLELVPPPGDAAGGSGGELVDGDVIPLARSGRFPETEEVLAALAGVLNGGGLNQVRTITTELNAALDGREPEVRALITNLNGFVGTLDARRTDIVRAIEGIDRFGTRLNADREKLAGAIDALPGGLRALNDQRADLVKTLDALGELGDVAHDVLRDSQDDLVADLRHLRPALDKLADSGRDLTESLSLVLSYPFPSRTSFPAVLKGDYGNLYVTVNGDPTALLRNFGVGLPLPLLNGLPPIGAGTGGIDPLTAPYLDAPKPLPKLTPLPGTLPAPGDLLPAPRSGGAERKPDPVGDVLRPLTGGR
jgi:phospholipid/cholesterol/gamma-HCH transport system substrate-binding protein